MRSGIRTILAFLVAPLVAAAAVATMVLIYGQSDSIVMMTLIPLFYVVCAAPLVLVGVPVYFILAYLGWLNFRSILSAGIGIGTLVAVAVRFPDIPELRELAIYVSVSGLAACAFWSIWRGGGRKTEVV